MNTKLFLATLLFFVNQSNARDLATIQKSGVLILGTEGTLLPFNYFKDAKLTGFEVELANHLLQKMNLKAEWKTGEFKSLLIGLNTNHYDVTVASHAITEERKAAFDFLTPHYCSGPIILSRQEGPSTQKELKSKVAAAKVGTIYFKALEKIPGIKEVKSLPGNPELLQALLLKKVDSIIVNEFAAAQMIAAQPQAKLKIGEKIMEEQLGMAVKKGTKDLLDALNKELLLSMKDGSYLKLSQKYFGRDISCPASKNN